MTAWTRIAGWGVLADGSEVTWTVADGRKGRRWREVVTRGTAVIHALLLESDRERRFSHLELARPDGLWTFHPELDGMLHGNHVGRGEMEVRHVVGWPFGSDHELIVEGSPVSLAALAWRRASSVADGVAVDVAGVVIRLGGDLDQAATVRIERLSRMRWRVGEGDPFEVDDEGLPLLHDGETRALELVPPAFGGKPVENAPPHPEVRPKLVDKSVSRPQGGRLS